VGNIWIQNFPPSKAVLEKLTDPLLGKNKPVSYKTRFITTAFIRVLHWSLH